jgi:hypothetical protein
VRASVGFFEISHCSILSSKFFWWLEFNNKSISHQFVHSVRKERNKKQNKSNQMRKCP